MTTGTDRGRQSKADIENQTGTEADKPAETDRQCQRDRESQTSTEEH